MDDDQFDGFVCFARSYLSDPNLTLDSTAAEGRARGYLFRDRPRGDPDGFLARLIRESKYDKSSWDALNLIAQKLIREGGLLEPTELAEWTADVLADQSAKRRHTTRPRPSKGGHATAGRDWNIYFLLGRLHTNWDLKTDSECTSGQGLQQRGPADVMRRGRIRLRCRWRSGRHSKVQDGRRNLDSLFSPNAQSLRMLTR